MTRKMTKEEAIRKHRKMWNWLAENPGKYKKDYFKKFDPKARLSNYGYLCKYVIKNHKDCKYNPCECCPLEWPGGSCGAIGEGLFTQWSCATDFRKYTLAAEIAKQIAELPEKEEKSQQSEYGRRPMGVFFV